MEKELSKAIIVQIFKKVNSFNDDWTFIDALISLRDIFAMQTDRTDKKVLNDLHSIEHGVNADEKI